MLTEAGANQSTARRLFGENWSAPFNRQADYGEHQVDWVFDLAVTAWHMADWVALERKINLGALRAQLIGPLSLNSPYASRLPMARSILS